MAKIRVLVVDDAVVFRRLLSDALSSDPAIEVVGTAANGRIALAKLPQVCPDLVILDVEMPEMDGLATLAELRRTYPRLPVIMFSALTERGAAATLDALALGATDYFTKPGSAQTGAVASWSLEASLEVIREELIPAIKALCPPSKGFRDTPTTTRPTATGSAFLPPSAGKSAQSISPPQRSSSVEVLTIGTSTGGPNALAEIIPRLPKDFPVPVVIVQHMPPMFTRLLAERLSAQSGLKVEEGRTGTILQPGHVWIAPGDHHMIVARQGTQVRMLLHQDPPENSCRPAVDVLFRSVAQAYGPRTLAVILTGMGQDGLRGCEAIRAAGGQILAQDEASSVVWGMPGYVARAGLADRVLPLAMITSEIRLRVSPHGTAGRGEHSN